MECERPPIPGSDDFPDDLALDERQPFIAAQVRIRQPVLIDDVCVLRSVYTDNPNHGPALFCMNNGTITPTRPSMGSWMLYGLGTENEDLPGYVVLCPGRPVRFAELWTSAFLPGEFQGTYINHTNPDPQKMVPFLRHATRDPATQRRQLDLLRELDGDHAAARGHDPALETRIKAMETAFRMSHGWPLP